MCHRYVPRLPYLKSVSRVATPQYDPTILTIAGFANHTYLHPRMCTDRCSPYCLAESADSGSLAFFGCSKRTSLLNAESTLAFAVPLAALSTQPRTQQTIVQMTGCRDGTHNPCSRHHIPPWRGWRVISCPMLPATLLTSPPTRHLRHIPISWTFSNSLYLQSRRGYAEYLMRIPHLHVRDANHASHLASLAAFGLAILTAEMKVKETKTVLIDNDSCDTVLMITII